MIKMHSLITKKRVNSGTMEHLITVTAIRMDNDINGNPRHKIHIWTTSNNGSIWSPKVKGYKRGKDDSYVLVSTFNLDESINHFLKEFERAIQQ
jgi:hypothetical protein